VIALDPVPTIEQIAKVFVAGPGRLIVQDLADAANRRERASALRICPRAGFSRGAEATIQ